MNTKFIKLEVKTPGEQELISPTFITRIRRADEKTVIYTMDGNSVYTEESVDSILKKIKDSEKFILDVK